MTAKIELPRPIQSVCHHDASQPDVNSAMGPKVSIKRKSDGPINNVVGLIADESRSNTTLHDQYDGTPQTIEVTPISRGRDALQLHSSFAGVLSIVSCDRLPWEYTSVAKQRISARITKPVRSQPFEVIVDVSCFLMMQIYDNFLRYEG